MVQAGKKVNFYRLALGRGKMHRMSLSEDDRLIGQGGGVFGYLAPVFDSADYQGTWHRLCLEGTFSNCKIEVMAAATDANLEDVLLDSGNGLSDWISILKDHGAIRKVNTDDFLLHSLEGRYLWVLLVVSGARIDSSFRIEGFSVEFPQSSFVQYLPEIYQEQGRDSFFERYMAVLQSLYEDLEKEVDKVPQYLDYETTPEENLPLFAQWTGRWNEDGIWSGEQLRYIIRHLSRIQNGRGTWAVMEQMIYLLTGKHAILAEHFKWKDWMKGQSTLLEDYDRLFGSGEDIFAVILDATRSEPEITEMQLEKRLEDYTPLGMRCKVIYLRKNSYMDTQCYLDKNSFLSIPRTATTEGFSLGGDYVLG